MGTPPASPFFRKSSPIVLAKAGDGTHTVDSDLQASAAVAGPVSQSCGTFLSSPPVLIFALSRGIPLLLFFSGHSRWLQAL
jgi:hypothetical protein